MLLDYSQWSITKYIANLTVCNKQIVIVHMSVFLLLIRLNFSEGCHNRSIFPHLRQVIPKYRRIHGPSALAGFKNDKKRFTMEKSVQ